MTTHNIKILGPGCRNCVALDKVTREAVAELGIDADVEKIEDYAEIATYNILSTPGLVLDGKLVLAGRVPTARGVKELIAGELGITL